MPMNEASRRPADRAGSVPVGDDANRPDGESPVVELTVLGPVGVRRSGETVEVAPRLRRLLAGLVVSAGDVVSTGRLIEIVWSGDEPAGADKALRTYVSRLRRVLGDEHQIVHREPGYVLELAASGLDSALFDEDLDDALSLLRTSEHHEAARLLDSAAERWNGPAFAGVAEEEWARPEAVRLQERLVEAREARIEATLASDRIDSAVSLARSLVEAEPLRERPRALLMRSLHAAGRQAEALRVARAYRRFLADETGLEASGDLAELEDRIARNDASLSGSVRPLRGYELGERIGEGAYSVVHRAVQPGVDRDVAVKIIRPELADRPDFIRRFELEARTVARIEHPNIVPIIDFWREPGAAFLVMRLLDGGSVEQALRRDGPFSTERVLRLLEDVGGALGAAHRISVVHRDVRPANLLLDTDGTAYVADFGIALPTAAVDASPVISPAYAAPEILRNEPAGATADVFALGVTVFELLAGRTPFADTLERRDLIQRQLAEPLPALTSIRTDLPAAIDAVLARATAKDPADRHATVAALVDDVGTALEPSTTRPLRSHVRWAGDAENPYVGLHRFDEEDASRFFGREQLVAELVDRMAQQRMVVAVGPSGSGKSSVVRAGLLPEIRRGAIDGSNQWFVAPMLPGSDPVAGLEAALLRIAVNPPSSLREQLDQPGGLLRAIRRVLPDDDSQLLLVVDQFEELFTQVDDPEVRDRFLAEIATAIDDPRSPVRVVATLRADHYDAPLRDPNLAELVTDGTVTVRPMTPAELERAITRPAESVGVAVEPALVTELVAGVTASPAALPLLQFSLTELYDRRVADTMLLSSHVELGGLAGALAARAERLLAEGGPADVEAARRIFGRLAAFGDGLDDRRRRARRSEFADDDRTQVVLDAFVEARLLTTDRDAATREPTVEVAHEALLREWPRLTEWLADDRDVRRSVGAIGQAAVAWDAGGRQDADLYRGSRLEAALDVAASAGDRLVALDHEFLAASRRHAVSERELERRRLRRLRRLVVGTAAALVVALIAGAVAVTQQRRADRQATAAEAAASEAELQREVAEQQTEVAQQQTEVAQQRAEEADAARTDAEQSELLARASAAAVARPEQAVLLALEAHRRDPRPESVRQLLDTIASGRSGNVVRSFGRTDYRQCDGVVDQRRLTEDGRWEVVASGGELVRLDLGTGARVVEKSLPDLCAGLMWTDAEGRTWVTSDLEAHWFRDGTGEWTPVRRVIPGGALVTESIGRRVLFAQASERPDAFAEVVVADSTSLQQVAPALPDLDVIIEDDVPRFPRVSSSVEAGLFAVTQQSLGRSVGGGLVVALDADDGSERFRIRHSSAVNALSFSIDGRMLYIGGSEGDIAVVDVTSGQPVWQSQMDARDEIVHLGEREIDGDLIAVTPDSIQIFDTAGDRRGAPIAIPRTVEARVRDDGKVIVVPFENQDVFQTIDPDGGALVEVGWDVEDGRLVGLAAGRAATVGLDGVAHVMDLETGSVRNVDVTLPRGRTLTGGVPFRPIGAVPEGGGLVAWDNGRAVARWRDGEFVELEELATMPQRLCLTSGIFQTGDPGFCNADAEGGADELTGGYAALGAAVTYGYLDPDRGFAAPRVAFSFDLTADDLVVDEILDPPPYTTTAVAARPEGGLYLTLAIGTLRTYDAMGDRIAEVDGGLAEPFVVVPDRSSGMVALGGPGGAAVVDPATGDSRRIVDVGFVISLQFARDGSLLVLVDREGNVRLWDLEQDLLVGTLWVGSGTAPASPPWYDAATDSIWVATSGKVLRFGLDVDRWIDQACELVSRELTASEWERLVPGDEPQRPACG